ncbi:hypothetical protein ACFQ9J_22075 [Streptomyces sp. NPDC056529]|uniref:hypothetical protein n=1 Tax=Streptomyces sp. NPDC056529 TaxID=3345855 RepID=UPI0036C98C4A
MTRAWTLPLLFLLCGSALAGAVLGESPGRAAAILPVFVLLAVAHSPLVFPRSVPVEEARRLSAVDGRPIVFWRPGCRYCLRLRARLGRDARRLHWVDIQGLSGGSWPGRVVWHGTSPRCRNVPIAPLSSRSGALRCFP